MGRIDEIPNLVGYAAILVSLSDCHDVILLFFTMMKTSVKGHTLLLVLLVAITPSLVVCEVEVFNQGDGLRIQQAHGTVEVCSVG